MAKKKTHEIYVAELSQINKNIKVVDNYVNAQKPILHRCLIDGHEWNASPSNILRGHGCPVCCGNLKKSTAEYIKEVEMINPNIEVIEEYINARTKIQHRCKIDNYIWNVAPYVILRGDGCPRCAGNAKRNTYEYATEILKLNIPIEIIGEYINANSPIMHKCLIDGYEWEVSPANILAGTRCPKCFRRMLSQQFSKQHEQYIEDVFRINPDIEVIDTYINAKTPITHRCRIDGYMWMASPTNILCGKGCPRCQESIGERCVRQWLVAHNVQFEYQYTFDDCRDKKALPFDFYIRHLNIVIEFDGLQHFEPVDFAGKGAKWASEHFEAVKQHDQIKNNYCKDNNITLFRIPHWANIEEELKKFFIHLI